MLETLARKSLHQSVYFTEVLKRSAEATMHSLVRTVFSRLKDLEPDEAENQLAHDEEAEKVRTETAATSQTTEDPIGTTAIEGITTRPDVTVSSTPALSSSCE
jgi:brefeldin A-resistance guanine nucleotide exchange factor 1